MFARGLSFAFLSLLLLLVSSGASESGPADAARRTGDGNQWLAGIRTLLSNCPVKSARLEPGLTPSHRFARALTDCARRRALVAIDEILEDDVIPLVNGLELVKFQYESERRDDQEERRQNASVTFNIRKLLNRARERGQQEDKEVGWRERLTSRVARVLRTHVIKIDVERLRRPAIPELGTETSARAADGRVEPRGRRRRRRQMQMMPIIMMGVLLMGSVLIPMGFQFLAVLGGKALILAKMALMLSSIQGLKKIATNGVNYGLYHSPVPEGWHERSTGYHEVPYSVGASAATGAEHYGGAEGYLDSLGLQLARRSAVQPT